LAQNAGKAAQNSAAATAGAAEDASVAPPVAAVRAGVSSERLAAWYGLLRRSGRAFLADAECGFLFLARALEPELPAWRERFAAGIERVRDTGYEFWDRDGEARDVLFLPVFDDAGTLVAIAGAVVPPEAELHGRPEDDLGRVALEAALDDAERRIDELETRLAEARDAGRRSPTFLAEISHELRTPLNAIVGFSDAALQGIKGPLPAPYRDYLQSIRDAGRHLTEIVDGTLDAARLEGGHVKVELRPASARVLVNDARSMIALKAEGDGIDVSRVALKGDFLLEVDPIRTRQILVNLLGNAVKFTPMGGEVGVDAAALDEEFVDLTVWDTGPGIDPAEQQRIFEAFYQVPGTAFHPSSKGTGLGLAIARQLARLMGGDILLWSEPGKGARFTVQLRRMRSGAPE
jgi:signal transduction histidine kinase